MANFIIENLKVPNSSEGITSLLKSGHEVIDQIAGKPRVKEVDWKQSISLGRP